MEGDGQGSSSIPSTSKERPDWLRTMHDLLVIGLLVYDIILASMDYMGAKYMPAVKNISAAHKSDYDTMTVLGSLKRTIMILAVPAVCFLYASNVYYSKKGGEWDSLRVTASYKYKLFCFGWVFMAVLSSIPVLECHLEEDLAGVSLSEWFISTIETGSAHFILLYFFLLTMAHVPLFNAFRGVSEGTRLHSAVIPFWVQVVPYVGVVTFALIMNMWTGICTLLVTLGLVWWYMDSWGLPGWSSAGPFFKSMATLSRSSEKIELKATSLFVYVSFLPCLVLFFVKAQIDSVAAQMGLLLLYIGVPALMCVLPSNSFRVPLAWYPGVLSPGGSPAPLVINTGLFFMGVSFLGHILFVGGPSVLEQHLLYMPHFRDFFTTKVVYPFLVMAVNHSMYLTFGFLYFLYYPQLPNMPKGLFPGLAFTVVSLFGFRLFHHGDVDLVMVVCRFTFFTYKHRWARVLTLVGSYFEFLTLLYIVQRLSTGQKRGVVARFMGKCSFGVLVVYKIILVVLACVLSRQKGIQLGYKTILLGLGVFGLSYGLTGVLLNVPGVRTWLREDNRKRPVLPLADVAKL